MICRSLYVFVWILTMVGFNVVAQNLPTNIAPVPRSLPQLPVLVQPTPTPIPSARQTNLNPPKPGGGALDNVKDEKAKGASDLLSGIIEDYTYVPSNKRDPFLPYESSGSVGSVVGPVFPLQKFDVDQLKLVGIIWDVKSPKAMVIDPQGIGYVVRLNERIGRNSGYIARIRESEVVIIEKFKGNDGITSYVTKLMKLSN